MNLSQYNMKFIFYVIYRLSYYYYLESHFWKYKQFKFYLLLIATTTYKQR